MRLCAEEFCVLLQSLCTSSSTSWPLGPALLKVRRSLGTVPCTEHWRFLRLFPRTLTFHIPYLPTGLSYLIFLSVQRVDSVILLEYELGLSSPTPLIPFPWTSNSVYGCTFQSAFLTNSSSLPQAGHSPLGLTALLPHTGLCLLQLTWHCLLVPHVTIHKAIPSWSQVTQSSALGFINYNDSWFPSLLSSDFLEYVLPLQPDSLRTVRKGMVSEARISFNSSYKVR